MSVCLIKEYTGIPFDRDEILRYAGCRSKSEEISALAEECIKEAENVFSYKVCYSVYPINIKENKVQFPFAQVNSAYLAKKLEGCNGAVVFGATVGLGIDRLIAKYGILSPAKAVIFQALGAERIESLCNTFNKEIKEKYKNVKPRMSPGYGDIPLKLQRDIFSALDCPRKIGLTLNESMLMSPSKSVTAIIGISGDEFFEDY